MNMDPPPPAPESSSAPPPPNEPAAPSTRPNRLPGEQLVNGIPKNFTEVEGVDYFVPLQPEIKSSYVAAMFGLENNAELSRLFADSSILTILTEYTTHRKDSFKDFGGPAIKLGTQPAKDLPAILKSTFLPAVFQENKLDFSRALIQNHRTNPGLVFWCYTLVALRMIMAAAPAYFSDPGERIHGYSIVSWIKAYCLQRCWKRAAESVSKVKRAVKAEQAVALHYRRDFREGTPPRTAEGGEALVDDTDVAPLDFDELIPDEENIDPLQFDSIQMATEMLNEFMDREKNTREDRPERRPLDPRARTRVLNQIMSRHPIVHEGAGGQARLRRYAQMGISSATNDAENAGDDDVDLDAAERKEVFWRFQSIMNGGGGSPAPSYADACEALYADPDTSVILIPQRAGQPDKPLQCKPWQLTGAKWLWDKEREGLQPILADDCGVGKTLTTYLRLHHQLRLARQGDLQPPFRPALIVAPSVLANNWYSQMGEYLGEGMEAFVWHSRGKDIGTLNRRDHVIEGSERDLLTWLDDNCDPNQAETLRKVVITSYTTGLKRALYDQAGERAIGVIQARKRRARREAQKTTRRLLEADAADGEAEEFVDDAQTLREAEENEAEEAASAAPHTSRLAGRFGHVVCDEAHKIKNSKTLTFQFIAALKPASCYIFITATPIANLPIDFESYLQLNWKPEWAELNPEIDPEKPLSAFGMHHTVAVMSGQAAAETVQDVLPTPRKGHLNPQLFHACIKSATLEKELAARVLPTIFRQLCLRRTFADHITLHNGTVVHIGDAIPPYSIATVELGLSPTKQREYNRLMEEFVGRLHEAGGPDPAIAQTTEAGRRNMAAHRALCHLSASQRLTQFADSAARKNIKANVELANELFHQSGDKGMTIYQKYTCRDGAVPTIQDRASLARYILADCPKLAWLMRYLDQCHQAGERVLVFTQWPLVQWMIEGLMELLGFRCESVRAMHTIKQRNDAIARFNDHANPLDAMVIPYLLGYVGLNVQRTCSRIVHVEVPGSMAIALQANGRCHRLGQTREQQIFILTLDGTYDIFLQHHLAKKFLPELYARVMADRSFSETTQGAGGVPTDEQIEGMIADMLGQRRSRLGFSELQQVVRFAELPDDAKPVGGEATVAGGATPGSLQRRYGPETRRGRAKRRRAASDSDEGADLPDISSTPRRQRRRLRHGVRARSSGSGGSNDGDDDRAMSDAEAPSSPDRVAARAQLAAEMAAAQAEMDEQVAKQTARAAEKAQQQARRQARRATRTEALPELTSDGPSTAVSSPVASAGEALGTPTPTRTRASERLRRVTKTKKTALSEPTIQEDEEA